MLEPFALSTLSYWTFLRSNNIHSCPPLIHKTVQSDIHYLQQLQGTYHIIPTASNDLLASNLKSFTIKHINGILFEFTLLGNLIHQRSVDNSDNFKLGITTFSSQVHEGDIEQSTMYNKEIFHHDDSCLIVMTNDYRYDWFSDNADDELKFVQKVVITLQKLSQETIKIDFKKTQSWYTEEPTIHYAQAKYMKIT